MAPRCTHCVRTCPSKPAAAAAACAPELAPSPLRPSGPPPPAATHVHHAMVATRASGRSRDQDRARSRTIQASGRSRCNQDIAHPCGLYRHKIRINPRCTRPRPPYPAAAAATLTHPAAAARISGRSRCVPPAASIQVPGRSRIKTHDAPPQPLLRPRPLQRQSKVYYPALQPRASTHPAAAASRSTTSARIYTSGHSRCKRLAAAADDRSGRSRRESHVELVPAKIHGSLRQVIGPSESTGWTERPFSTSGPCGTIRCSASLQRVIPICVKIA